MDCSGSRGPAEFIALSKWMDGRDGNVWERTRLLLGVSVWRMGCQEALAKVWTALALEF
jgi:hypothetical protein